MRVWISGALVVLFGCAAPGVPPAGMSTTRVEARSGVVAPPVQGESRLLVRAVETGTPGRELAGVPCTADSTWFHASFTAPTQLLLPDYGASAPAVSVQCRTAELAGAAVAQPEAAWTGELGGWPAVGLSVGTGNRGGVGLGVGWYGGGAGATSGVPVTRYPDLRVAME